MLTQLTHNRAQSIIEALMSHEGHLSYSSISAFLETPEKFVDYKMGIKEETDAMLYGSMVHCLVLEPEDFPNRYFVLDDREVCAEIGGAKPRATNKYKEWRNKAQEDAAGKIIVETDDYLNAEIVAQSVHRNRASRKVLKMATNHEIPVEWEFKNFKFKGFIDGEGECYFDLKTMLDADRKKVQREIIDRKLYLQAAMYIYARKEYKPYYIIAVDKKKGVSVHLLHQKLIEIGMDEYDEIMNKFNLCILEDRFDESHDFHSERNDGIFVCEPPKWLF